MARAIYNALVRHNRDALVCGEPEAGERTIIDGNFDLRAVARIGCRNLSKGERLHGHSGDGRKKSAKAR